MIEERRKRICRLENKCPGGGRRRKHLKSHCSRGAVRMDRSSRTFWFCDSVDNEGNPCNQISNKGHHSPLAGYKSFGIIYRQGKILHDRAMREFDLTGQQMGYLKHIYETPGVSQEELAKEQRIDKGAVAKAIKDMIEKGFITREQNPDDKRAYCLFPTDKGEKTCSTGKENAAKIERHLTDGMTEEEIETFKVLLDKITDNIAKMLEGGIK